MSDQVTLTVNGTVHRGWTSVRITLGMEQIAGTFSLGQSERWSGQETPWPIYPGDQCRLAIGDDAVITGYVDDSNPEYDKESHGIQIQGRDRTGDLVDCAAIHKSGQWRGVTLTRICADLCKPFGIPVTALIDVGRPFPSFALQEGETAFEAMERAARMRAVLLMSDGQGGLLLTRASAESLPVALERGVNIERASGTFSHKDRFSRYIIKGQAPGDDIYSKPEHHTQTMATADDAAVERHRPTIIIAEPGSGSTYKDRAVWERNVRAGRSARVTYTVSGWRHAGGLWRPNRLVTLRDDWMKAPGLAMVAQVTYVLDDSGSRTELEVTRPEAFDLVNLPNTRRRIKTGEVMPSGTAKDATVKERTRGISPW